MKTGEKAAASSVETEAISPENAKAVEVEALATQTVPTVEEVEVVVEEIEDDPHTAEIITGDTPVTPALAVPRNVEATLQKVVIGIVVGEEVENVEEAEVIHIHEIADLQLETALAILLRRKGTDLKDLAPVQDHSHLAGLTAETKETGGVLHQEQTRE